MPPTPQGRRRWEQLRPEETITRGVRSRRHKPTEAEPRVTTLNGLTTSKQLELVKKIPDEEMPRTRGLHQGITPDIKELMPVLYEVFKKKTPKN